MKKYRKLNDPICGIKCWTDNSICIGERGCAEYYKKYLRRPIKREAQKPTRKKAKKVSAKHNTQSKPLSLVDLRRLMEVTGKCSVCGSLSQK
jgi:hypothetical protein